MKVFKDEHGSTVRLSFQKNSFNKRAEHVLVICRFYNQWLLTEHKKRGYEFPGGKREDGETLEETARREVLEEAGAQLKTVEFLGEYEVVNERESFVKAIFYGEVENLIPQDDYMETKGPVLVSGDLLTLRFQPSYSFMMKDQVIEEAIQILGEKHLFVKR